MYNGASVKLCITRSGMYNAYGMYPQAASRKINLSTYVDHDTTFRCVLFVE